MLITNGKIITWGADSRLIEGGALRVVDGVISEIGASDELAAKHPHDDVVDAGGQYVMPGNICAHTHFYGAYARGMAIKGPAPKDFPEILERLWWPLDKALDSEAVRFSTLVSLIDAIKHGTTTLIDHHASPNAIAGSLDVIADAVDQAGLRAVLCYEVTDRDGDDRARAGIEENIRFLEAARARPLIGATFGLHAGLTVGDNTLQACVDAAQEVDAGFHIHVAEHEVDQYHSLQRYGMRVVDRLHQHGVLGPKTIVAHCVHTNPWELATLRETGTWISHQPRSNMNNAVGAAPLDALLEGNARVVLGNDGFSNNMWAEWKAAYLLHKAVHRDPRRAPGDGIARMAIENNARLAEVFFPGDRIGSLTQGAVADLIFVDYKPFTPLTMGNLPWHIIFGFEASMVTSTMVSGRWLMRDRKLLTLDENAIAEAARAVAPNVWKKYEVEVGKVLGE